jgi:WD40 repeat protein
MADPLSPRMRLVLKNLATQDGGDVGQDRPQATRAELVYPWISPTKLSDPATLPTGTALDSAWSPDGRFLAVAHASATTPYLTIYERSGTTFTKLADPGTLPTGAGSSVAWSPDGRFLAVGHLNSPYVTIYERSGTTFTKLANPATLPGATGYGSAWSPDGLFLAVSYGVTGGISQIVYKRSGTAFTTVAPGSNPPSTGNGQDCAWSPDGRFLAVAHASSPYIRIWQTGASGLVSPLPSAAVVTAPWLDGD